MKCDSDHIEGVAHALVAIYHGTTRGIMAENSDFDIARSLAPDVPAVHFWYACFYAPQHGQKSERNAEFQKAIDVDTRGDVAARAKRFINPFNR